MKFSSISVITAGPALGHDCQIDSVTLAQVLELGNQNSPLKVFPDNNETVTDLIGAMSNFYLDETGTQVKADLDLIEENPLSGYYAKILDIFPESLGFSISWTGSLEEIDGKKFARVSDLTSVDLVAQPAANPTGVYSAKISSRKLKAQKAAAIPTEEDEHDPSIVADESLPGPVEESPADVAAKISQQINQHGVDSEDLDNMSNATNNTPQPSAEEALSASLMKALEPIAAALAALNDKLDVLAKAEAQEVIGDQAEESQEDEGMSAKLAEITAKLSVLESASTGSAPVAGAAFEQSPSDLAAAYEALSGKEQFAFAKKHFNQLRAILPKNLNK